MPNHPPKSSHTNPLDWWSHLNYSLITLILSLIVSATLILSSQQYYRYVTDWTRQQNSRFGQIEAKYSQVQAALEIVNKLYLKKFNQLVAEGFFLEDSNRRIEEQRLKMVDEIEVLLSRMKSQRKLFKANYTLAMTTLYTIPKRDTVPQLIIEPEFRPYETQLSLDLELLHEQDLLELIKAIEFQKIVGLFNLQTCDINRLRDINDTKDISKPYFSAHCLLNWYTSKIESDSGG